MTSNNSSNKITISSGALFATLLVALMGTNFLDLPYYASKSGGPSGYWSILLAFILISPLAFVAQAFQNRFPGRNLLEVAPEVIGKPLALIGNLLFLSGFFIWLIFALRDGANLIHVYLLDLTPLQAIMLILLVCIGYVAGNGLAAVVRFMNFLLIPPYILRLFVLLLTLQRSETTHLLPFFSETPGSYLLGGLELTGFFIPIPAIFFLSSKLKNRADVWRVTLWALAGILPIYMLAFVGTVGSLGVEYTQYFAWPEIPTTNHIDIPFLVLEQVGLLFLIIWITTFYGSKILYFYIVTSGLRTQFPVLKYRWTLMGLLILEGALAMLFPNVIMERRAFIQVRPWLMVPLIGYPAIVYLIAVIRGKRGVIPG